MNMPQIIPFQITLSFMVIRIEKFQIFILPSGSSGKDLKFQKNLKFQKKS